MHCCVFAEPTAREVLAESFAADRGELALESEIHGVQLVLPNFDEKVPCSVFVDGSLTTVELDGAMHVVLPIVSCGPHGTTFASPLKLRFPVGDLEDAAEGSDSEENEGDDRVGSYRQALAGTFKVSCAR